MSTRAADPASVPEASSPGDVERGSTGDPPEVPTPSVELGNDSDLYDSLLQRVAGVQEPVVVAPPTPGSLLDGKYRIESALGRGGMGFVFRARHAVTGRAVALKWMLPRQDAEQARLRFLREAQAIGRIRHPNVVDIFDVVEAPNADTDGSPGATYLVMELLEGETLRARLSRGTMEISEAVDLALALLGALRAAHQQGVIHRDLKPENVFLARDESGKVTPKVLDFGISTFAEGEHVQKNETLTQTGQFIGTPIYTALERLRENQPFDHRVDLYSVGVMLYEALTGRLPFTAHNVSELTFQLVTADPVAPSALRAEIPAALEAVVLKALSKDPESRPANAESFARELEATRAAVEPAPPASATGVALSRASTPDPFPRPNRSWLIAGAAGLLVAGVAFALATGRRPDPVATGSARAAVPEAEPNAVVTPRGELTATASPALSTAPVPLPPPGPSAVAAAPTAVNAAPTGTAGAPTKPHASTPARDRAGAARTTPSGPAATTGSGELAVVVLPYGNVWIDGRKIGASPVTTNVPSGAHIVAAGRDTPERQSAVTLTPGESRRVVLSLRP